MKIDVQGRGARQDLERTRKRINARTHASIVSTMRAMLAFMRCNGYRDRTGRLSASMRADVMRRGFLDYRMTVGAYTKYALWVDQPTRPHEIHAKRVPNLVFFWERMGVWFIGPKVNHPGTRGAFFSNQTRKLGASRLRNALAQAVDSAAGGAS